MTYKYAVKMKGRTIMRPQTMGQAETFADLFKSKTTITRI